MLRTNPDYVAALNNMGSLLSSLDRCDDAADCFRRAIARNPNSAEFHCNLANTLTRSGRFEQAVAEYRESIHLNSQLPETYNNLATALSGLGRHEEALAELTHALALRPDYAEAQVNQVTIEQAALRNATGRKRSRSADAGTAASRLGHSDPVVRAGIAATES